MSFKYRFIFSFVLLEIIFILLIVVMNFITIQNSSRQLIDQKINSNITFLQELLRIPVSVYDLATIDNFLSNAIDLKQIQSIVVLDSQDNILAKEYDFERIPLDELILAKKNSSIKTQDEVFEIRYERIELEGTLLGSFYIIFDTGENARFIEKNKRNTFLIIFFEILVSTLLSFIIGSRLTKVLDTLSKTAEEIGLNKNPEIPFTQRKDEIGTLAKSMQDMQIDLLSRNRKLKELAIELNRQKDELIEADKYKNDFLANMSHELKTPLNSINVISSVMMKNKKGLLNQEHVNNMEVVNRCGKDLLYLINDVLDISKLEAGEVEVNYETIDFAQMMIRIKDMIEPQVKAKNLNLIYFCDEKLTFIYSDRNRIKQIVKNLLSNALKFAEKGDIELKVSLFEDKLKLSVKDSGIGIPKEKLENIFDRFKQVDGSTTRKYGGTGLGLAICKELAQLLNGDITVTSEVNKGANFTLVLPLNLDKVQEKDIKDDKTLEPSLQVESVEKIVKVEKIVENNETSTLNKNILILHKDPLTFMQLMIALKASYSVRHIDCVSMFVTELNKQEFAEVIIDTSKIKEEDILKVLKYFKKEAILINEEEPSKTLLEYSKASFLKPFNKDDVFDVIRNQNG